MAIRDHLEVTILVDGEPATGYDDTSSSGQPNEPNMSTKYIEVTSGSRFAFNMKVLPGYQHIEEEGLAFVTFVDGNKMRGTFFSQANIDAVTGLCYIEDSTIVGNGTEMKKLMFRFKDLETCDTCEEDVASLEKKYSRLGCLDATMFRARIIGSAEQPHANHPKSDEDIPGKALKGRAVTVAAKVEAVPMDEVAPRLFRTNAIGEHALARFSFHYRTRAALKPETIIPRSPSPAHAEETAVEDLTLEEMREIIRRQREQAIKVEDEVPNLKRERPLSSIVPSATHEDFQDK